jgi:hypothetical protein
MRAGMVRPGRSGWGSSGEAGQGVAVAACSMTVLITNVSGLCQHDCRPGPMPGESHHRLMCTLGETVGSAGRATARWAWGLACPGCCLAEKARRYVANATKNRHPRASGDPSGMGRRLRGNDGVVCGERRPSGVCYIKAETWRELVHGVLAARRCCRPPARSDGAAAAGGVNWCMRSWLARRVRGSAQQRAARVEARKGLTQMQADGRGTRRWDRGRRIGIAHQGLPLVFAVNPHAGVRPIRVFSIHLPASALNLSCLAAPPHRSATERCAAARHRAGA